MRTNLLAVIAVASGAAIASPTAPIGIRSVHSAAANTFFFQPEPAVKISSIDGEYSRVSRMNGNGNRLIAGFTNFETVDGEPGKVLRTAISTDWGRSWSPLGEVFRGKRSAVEIDNAFPLQLPSGRVLYAYRNHDKDPATGQFKWFRISISYSDDEGKSFKYLSTVEEHNPNGVNGLWEPFLRIARDGSLQCYYSAENDAGDQDGFMKFSTDGGLTWSSFVAVSGGDRRSRDGMIGVAPLNRADGLIAVFEETDRGGNGFQVSAVFSNDDGKTWGSRKKIYTPSRSAGAPQVYNVWGTLIVSFMTNDFHDNGDGYNKGDVVVIASDNDGESFTSPVIVGEAPARWPGLFNLDAEHFLALYSRDGVGLLSQVWKFWKA